MAKRLQLKFSRVMHSFQFCRPKSFSSFPDDRPASVVPKTYDISYPNIPALLQSTPEHYLGCRCKSTSCKNLCSEKSPIDVEMHVASLSVGARSRGGVDGVEELLSGSRLAAEGKKGRKNRKKKAREGLRANGLSLSSRWSVGYEGDEESRRSFSNDFSYELIDPATPMIEKPNGGTSSSKRKIKNAKIPRGISGVDVCGDERTAAGMWQRMPCSGNEKVRESYVTVKKTDQPYEDFQRSMLEMILEKEMLQGEELEELLQWFLALNSPQYHGMIVKAFSEIWEVLFCDSLVQE